MTVASILKLAYLALEYVNEPIAFKVQLVKYFESFSSLVTCKRDGFYDLLATEIIFSGIALAAKSCFFLSLIFFFFAII